MILKDTTNKIESSGTTESQTFKMQQSRKAFTILSDLYSDKPLAIVRELGCNAKDSMNMAGKSDQPFTIHLPNMLEPWITIRDFGTGISHKDIYDIYAVYFSSTKTNSNNQIGCLGLGSKSPFCYTDNFTITSIVNGEKRIYNAYFNEQNMPTISLMSTENTNDINGVAIQIPVKNEDFNRFTEAVKKAFRFFDVKPNITGGVIAWDDEKPMFEGDGWKSYEGFGYDEAFAVMGGVAYKIDTHKINSLHQNMVRQTGLVIYFNMGELDFTPSRESLSYCEMTIKALNDKIVHVKNNFALKYNEIIQSKDNILDALRSVYIFNSKFSFLDSALKTKAALWKGIDISSPETYIRKIVGGTNTTAISYSGYGRSKYRISDYITLDSAFTWYRDDLSRGSISRVKNYVKNNPKEKIMIVSEEAYQKLKTIGIKDDVYKLISTLPKVSNTGRVKNNNTGSTYVPFKLWKTSDDYWNEKFESYDYDPSNPPKYYIEKVDNSFNFNLSNNVIRCDAVGSFRDILKHYKFSNTDVVFVSQRGAKQLQIDGVKPFKTFLDSIKNVVNVDSITNYEKYAIHLSNYNNLLKHRMMKEIHDDNPFKVFITNVCQSTKDCLNFPSFFKLENFSGGKLVELVSDEPIHHLLYENIGTYGWSTEHILTILKEFQNKGLTNPQTSATI